MIELDVHVCTIPTDEPESDGTAEWDSTTIVIVEARDGDTAGIGYTYCEAAAAELIRSIGFGWPGACVRFYGTHRSIAAA